MALALCHESKRKKIKPFRAITKFNIKEEEEEGKRRRRMRRKIRRTKRRKRRRQS